MVRRRMAECRPHEAENREAGDEEVPATACHLPAWKAYSAERCRAIRLVALAVAV